ncbi:hypothetical protein [Bartonella sp. B39]
MFQCFFWWCFGTRAIWYHKKLAKNVLNHEKAKDAAEGETKAAISDSSIILTDITGQRAMGQDAGQIIDALNRNTAAAHKAASSIDATSVEDIVQNGLDIKINCWMNGLVTSTKFLKLHISKASRE